MKNYPFFFVNFYTNVLNFVVDDIKIVTNEVKRRITWTAV